MLAEPPGRAGAARVAEALKLGAVPEASLYTETFVFQLYPYSSVYLGAEGMLGGEARDRVAGFWRALGQTPPAEPDHLPVLLALYARLCEFEEEEDESVRRQMWRTARRAFLWEHLLSWLPVYLDKLSEIAPPFYRSWGELLRAVLLEEVSIVGRQEELAAPLRAAPLIADPRQGDSREFISSLLAPARAGVILVRADLARAARKLGLGLRAGERRFALEALLGQNPRAVLSWLAEEVGARAERHAHNSAQLGAVAEWWRARAEATSELLRSLAEEAADAPSGLPS